MRRNGSPGVTGWHQHDSQPQKLRLLVAVISRAEPARPSRLREPLKDRDAPMPASSAEPCPATEVVGAKPPRDRNANPFGFGPWYVNADRTIWAHAGDWVSGPKSNKVPWIRPLGTDLRIAGRRLEGDAAPLRARIPCGYSNGFQVTRLFFASAGCWVVVSSAGSAELRLVTKVR